MALDISQLIAALSALIIAYYTYENERKMIHLSEDMDRISNVLNKLESKLDKRENVAFLACLGKNVLFTDYDVILFDDVITNYGNHYNPMTGVFTAPTKGSYNIDCKIDSPNNTLVGYNMKGNDRVFSSKDLDSKAMTIVWELDKGDEIYIKLQDPLERNAFPGGRRSYFFGYLINKS